MKVVIRQLNEQTISPNGLIYSKEVLEEIQKQLKQLKDKELNGGIDSKGKRNTKHQIDSINACISKNYRIEDENLVADIEFIGDKKDLLENGLINYQFGIRAITNNNSMNIKDIKIITFDLIQNKG